MLKCQKQCIVKYEKYSVYQNECVKTDGLPISVYIKKKSQNQWIAKIDELPIWWYTEKTINAINIVYPKRVYTQKECIVKRNSQKQRILNREMQKSWDNN